MGMEGGRGGPSVLNVRRKVPIWTAAKMNGDEANGVWKMKRMEEEKRKNHWTSRRKGPSGTFASIQEELAKFQIKRNSIGKKKLDC
jgi:hypothetical protein